jgi:pimeloyl-ACP methyl ester carboxylesterase
LCVHGLACRYAIYDAGDGFGLAPYLASRGFHVFALDLRGRGLSAPRHPLTRTAVFLRRGWTLGDFLSKDLPCVMDFALTRGGATQLDLVGHSMGGMLCLELLARTEDARVRRLVTLGSGDAPAMLLPLTAAQKQRERPQKKANVGLWMAPFALSTRYAPVHWGAKLLAVTLPLLPTDLRGMALEPALDTLLNPTNIDEGVLRTFLWRSLSGISAKKFWSFGKLYRHFATQGVVSDRHRHPTLLFAGARDGLVPPSKVYETASRARHPESRVIELSQEHGYSADYGHVDLLLGRNAEREVFPLIERFFSEQAEATRAA